MKLVVFTPEERIFDGEVTKVVAEATNGSFGMLERHIDIVAPLTAGIIVYEDGNGATGYLGVDEGILVKCDNVVSVAVRRAVLGRDLRELRRVVAEEFLTIDEQERVARSALARLEASVIRGMLDLEQAI